ncbi:KHP30-like phage protein [Helicobacter pylori NY40]|uniref:KHP30-like phage protein n=2 Tax=Helicobacter pylori TaxID=210 RepID=A0A060PTK3_HELPX|nr:KHP30-like phage protein [Helicobacter pylori NY40]
MPYIIIVFLLIFSANLKTKLALANERLTQNEAHLIKQNEIIQTLELESQQYKANKLLEVTKIKDKYHKIHIKDNTCEAKLESLEALINAFRKK